jgi:hypothetical protein
LFWANSAEPTNNKSNTENIFFITMISKLGYSSKSAKFRFIPARIARVKLIL